MSKAQRLMLAKKFRMTTGAFRLHARQRASHAVRSASFVVKSYPSEAPHPRFGVVIGKNVDARSTARNRIKRAVYDILGLALPHLPPADYICIMQPASAQKTQKELRNEFARALHLPTISHLP